MKRCVAVIVVVGSLGAVTQAAAAEPPVRAVGVQGVGHVAISPNANQGEANGTYRQAIVAAITDGHEKAEFLAGATGTMLGPVQAITEGGGSVRCTGPEGDYTEYPGAEPDFGYGSETGIFASAPASSAASGRSTTAPPTTHPVKKKKKKKHKTTAKKAAAGGCTVSAQISLSYALA